MQKQENKLANGMFIKEHTFKSGTTIYNVQIKCTDFIKMMKDNAKGDRKGGQWLNLKLIPNKNTTKYSHTPVVDTWVPKNADSAINNLSLDVLHKPSVQERAIVETPEKAELPF
mgnify:CR=1 FL=1|tara:strand:+ start:2246 stop:2587 length:342 start_codon:yes stop_codon:yes gene_type:complete